MPLVYTREYSLGFRGWQEGMWGISVRGLKAEQLGSGSWRLAAEAPVLSERLLCRAEQVSAEQLSPSLEVNTLWIIVIYSQGPPSMLRSLSIGPQPFRLPSFFSVTRASFLPSLYIFLSSIFLRWPFKQTAQWLPCVFASGSFSQLIYWCVNAALLCLASSFLLLNGPTLNPRWGGAGSDQVHLRMGQSPCSEWKSVCLLHFLSSETIERRLDDCGFRLLLVICFQQAADKQMMLISLLTINKPCSNKATYLTSCFRKCHTDAPNNTAAQAVQLLFQLKKQDFIMSNGWHLYLLLIPLFFLPPLLLCADWKILSFISLLLPATGAGWRFGARGTIQTEAFWNKGGDLTSAPRLAEQRDRVHRAGREVDNCRRPSFEVPHRSGTWEGVWGGGSLCWLVGTEPDKEKPEPQPVWGVIPVADNKGSEKGLCVCVCVFFVN